MTEPNHSDSAKETAGASASDEAIAADREEDAEVIEESVSSETDAAAAERVRRRRGALFAGGVVGLLATEPEVLPKGNPLNVVRGLATILGGAVPAFFLMAKNGQNAWAVPLGAVFVAVAAFGVMDLLGTFDDADDFVATRTTIAELGGPILRTLAVTIAFGGSLAGSQASIWPGWASAIAVTGSFLGLVACVFDLGRTLGPWATDELGLERPLLQRHGFWVLAIGALLYFPTLGLHSLWDPWETHYGEVAREVLARDDWISLWWAQDGWFWSKPILNFWIQSLSMASLGTHYRPDQMLIGAGGLPIAHPEWVVRTPNVLMTLGAMYLLYKGVSKVFGRRAGLFGALVLATMPDWFFLAHQTMTDMPFVAAMTAAMGLLLVGLNIDEDARVRVYEIDLFGRKLRLSLWHLVFGAVLLCALPQIVYLLSRNIELVVFGDGPKGFRFHWDEFRSGSAGNCGLPGNEACVTHAPASVPKSTGAHPDGLGPSFIRFFGGFEPALQAVLWSVVVGTLLYVNWGERRARRLVYIAAWLCAAIATMAKGPAGFGLPILCAGAYIATKRKWSEFLRLELLSGILIILAVAIPWYVAMYVRHGSPFTDRLIFHDMFNRAFSHVHDTNEGDDTGLRYYLWQLGYALFPWSGIAPIGLLWWLRRSDSEGRQGRGGTGATGDASVMLVMWFLFAYALFTAMGTKFHHYIFPAIPPLAMLIGVTLDDIVGERPLAAIANAPRYAAGMIVAALVATFGATKFWPGSLFGTKVAPNENTVLAVSIAALGGAIGVATVLLFREPESAAPGRTIQAVPDLSPFRGGVVVEGDPPEETQRTSHEQLMFAGAAVAGGLLTILVGRDLVSRFENESVPGAIRLLHLFTYNYRRPWPDTLDFSCVLAGFTLVAALLALLLGVRALRKHAIGAFCAFAFVWALWGVNVYMAKLSPHWGQHEVMEAYYKDRAGPEEQLVAYQMNWKGENFYTGNRVPAFVSSGATFQTWLKGQRDKGAKVMYFVTEHGRIGGLKSEVGGKGYKEITDKALCNKFVLVRAEL
jgi:4-amino-4-deoxy-L-arabinose transferase-like glycosyltransferase